MKRRYLYGKDSSWYVFNYGKNFWKAYSDSPKHLLLAFLDAHEGTGEVVKYMDEKLVDFFEFLESEGSLKDTVIVFQSDHGVNMPGFIHLLMLKIFGLRKLFLLFFLYYLKMFKGI
jgi:phosphoglycerol transferase MdoB-like AlkP superfamily enzyme